MNSPEWLEAIKQRATAKNLAEGPWSCSMGMFPDDDDLRPNAVYFAVEMPKQEMSRHTADFIGHSRTDISALLQLVEKQREALEDFKNSIETRSEVWSWHTANILKAHEKAQEALNFRPEGVE